MRFDAYAASIRGRSFAQVVEVLADSCQAVPHQVRTRGRFSALCELRVGNRAAASVGWDTGNELTFVEAKGETTPGFAQAIRAEFPDHGVPRFDVCQDFNAPGAQAYLIEMARKHKGPRVKGRFVCLPDDPEDGQTWQAGAPGGVAMLRVYESGKHPDRLHLGMPDLARLELEVRPHTSAHKVLAATMEPDQAWGFAAWTHRLYQAITDCDIPRVEVGSRQYPADKTGVYIARTFRRWFELQEEDGVDVMRTFRQLWQEDDELAARLGRRVS